MNLLKFIRLITRSFHFQLFLQTTSDLDEIDKQRRQRFKEYEMQKEHERKEQLGNMTEEQKKKAQEEWEDQQKKHKDHPKVHHPVGTIGLFYSLAAHGPIPLSYFWLKSKMCSFLLLQLEIWTHLSEDNTYDVDKILISVAEK